MGDFGDSGSLSSSRPKWPPVDKFRPIPLGSPEDLIYRTSIDCHYTRYGKPSSTAVNDRVRTALELRNTMN